MENLFLHVPNHIGFELIELANISKYGPSINDVFNLYTSITDRHNIIKRSLKDCSGDTLIEIYKRGQIQSSKLVNINGDTIDEVLYTYNKDDKIDIIESKNQRTFFKYDDGRCVGYRVFDIEPSGSATISETCSIVYRGPLHKISQIIKSDKYGKESKTEYFYTHSDIGLVLDCIKTKDSMTTLHYGKFGDHNFTMRAHANGDILAVEFKNDTPFDRPLFRMFYHDGVVVGSDKFKYSPGADVVVKYTDNFQKDSQKKYFYYDEYYNLVEIRRYTNDQQSAETELIIDYEYEEEKKNENDKR